MDLLKYIEEALLKKMDNEKINSILEYFSSLKYEIDWDDGVPENWINVRNNGEFICWIGVVIPIIFIIKREQKVIENYKSKNDFLILKIENYDQEIWEIRDINEYNKVMEKLGLYQGKDERLLEKFSTQYFWWSTVTA